MTAHGLIVTLALLCAGTIGGWLRAELLARSERRRVDRLAVTAARQHVAIRTALALADGTEAEWSRLYSDDLGGPLRAGVKHERLAGLVYALRVELDTAARIAEPDGDSVSNIRH